MILHVVCLLLYLLANLILVAVFIFIRYPAGRGLHGEFTDPSSQLMVRHLVDIVLESSAANTAYKYSNGLQGLKTWSYSNLGVLVLPAVLLQVAFYLTELLERAVPGHSASVIESALYSIRWGHRLAGMDSPTIHLLVKGVVEGARRRLARPVQPRQPLKHDPFAEITLTLNLHLHLKQIFAFCLFF